MTTNPVFTSGLTEEQQATFYLQLAAREKDEVAGVLLALFLGSFGAHHFYLRRNGLGILYLLFCWTAIPGLVSLVECFFMPSRVQRYNLEQAVLLAATYRGTPQQPALPPTLTQPCPACGAPTTPGVRYCARCGTQLS